LTFNNFYFLKVLESKPRKFSPGGVPAFAMGLSTSSVLQPIKTETASTEQQQQQQQQHLQQLQQQQKVQPADVKKDGLVSVYSKTIINSGHSFMGSRILLYNQFRQF
jgi:hypothetical protein